VVGERGKPVQMFRNRALKPLDKIEVFVVVDGQFAGKLTLEDGKTHAVYENTWAWYGRKLCGQHNVGVFIDRIKTKIEEGERLIEYRPVCGSINSPCPVDVPHVDFLVGEVEQHEGCQRPG